MEFSINVSPEIALQMAVFVFAALTAIWKGRK